MNNIKHIGVHRLDYIIDGFSFSCSESEQKDLAPIFNMYIQLCSLAKISPQFEVAVKHMYVENEDTPLLTKVWVE